MKLSQVSFRTIKHTVICVPCLPATGFGSALWPGFGGTSLPSEYTALYQINKTEERKCRRGGQQTYRHNSNHSF